MSIYDLRSQLFQNKISFLNELVLPKIGRKINLIYNRFLATALKSIFFKVSERFFANSEFSH